MSNESVAFPQWYLGQWDDSICDDAIAFEMERIIDQAHERAEFEKCREALIAALLIPRKYLINDP